jgi:hypothetical protein
MKVSKEVIEEFTITMSKDECEMLQSVLTRMQLDGSVQGHQAWQKGLWGLWRGLADIGVQDRRELSRGIFMDPLPELTAGL